MPQIMTRDQINAPDGRQRWLEARRHGIGASEILACIGKHPYLTAAQLWASKIHGTEQPDNPAMRHGRAFEASVAAMYTEDTGIQLEETGLWAHPDNPHHLATPDRLIGDTSGLEIKVTSERHADQWAEAPTALAEAQAQWCMHVTGRTTWVIAAHIHGHPLYIHHVERDDDMIAYYAYAADELWKHVENRQPLPIGYDTQTLYEAPIIYPSPDPGKVVDLSCDLEELIEDYRQARQVADAANAAVDDLKGRIQHAMGDAETVADADGEPVVTWRARTTTRVSSKLLRKNHPEIVGSVTQKSTYREMRIR